MSKFLLKLSTYHVVLITENGFPYAVQIADSQVRSPKRCYQRQSQNLTPVPLPYQEAKQLANQARRAYFPRPVQTSPQGTPPIPPHDRRHHLSRPAL